MITAQTGRTHGCSDQCCNVKILLANPEPSTHGPSRHFAAAQQLGRFRREADINWQARSAGSVENDPEPTFSLAVRLPTFDERMLF
jgi:hypothetical protein